MIICIIQIFINENLSHFYLELYVVFYLFIFFTYLFLASTSESQWIKLFDHPVKRFDPSLRTPSYEHSLPEKVVADYSYLLKGIVAQRVRRRSPRNHWFFVTSPKDEVLLSALWRSTALAQHILSLCRSFCFTGGLGCEDFCGSDLRRYRYSWLPPQDFLGIEYLDDLVRFEPVKFVSASSLSFYYGHDSSSGPSTDFFFALKSNPIDYPVFFMLMIEPAPPKTQFTFFTPSFHRRFYVDDEPEETSPSSWKSRLASWTHPREEEEIDYIYSWRYNFEKSILSDVDYRRFRSKHAFREVLVRYRWSDPPLAITWK